MKISLVWVFDHIRANWRDININILVDRFNKTTAEIERFEKISIDLDAFSLAKVKSIHSEKIVVFSQEWSQEFILPTRPDIALNCFYMLSRKKHTVRWATLEEWHCNKSGFIPALYCSKRFISGQWKEDFEAEDCVLEVDNKSITNRPDMWGHRGFAREIAAIFDLSLKPMSSLIKEKNVTQYKDHAPASDINPFDIKISHSNIIKRFAGLYFENITYRESLLFIACRLMRVGSRPVNALVDIANYVMLDISQPMHVFDANLLSGKKIIATKAKSKEKIILLDDDEVALTADDIVISDGKIPISVAGIMGGKSTGVSADTVSVFLESANFNGPTIRSTSFRIKKRTDASARFEKVLDPNQNITAIFRFLKLLKEVGIAFEVSDSIVSLGVPEKEKEITIEHDFIEKYLGINLDFKVVNKIFKKLEFKVTISRKKGNVTYFVIVPTFRCTKDVTIKEDLVEEIGRFFGYENIIQILPKKESIPFDISPVLRLRSIKRLLAFGLKMREVQNYPFYDESFLKVLQWQLNEVVRVQNPVSENLCCLVNSLIPNLFKVVEKNGVQHDTLRFFEWGRVWHNKREIKEKKVLSGVFFDAKKVIDFYDAKAILTNLFDLLNFEVKWEKISTNDNCCFPWFYKNQTARLLCGGSCVGLAGKVAPEFLSNIVSGDIFAFEIDGEFLLHHELPLKRFKTFSKYPAVERDISILVPISATVDKVINLIKSCDKKIIDVALIDFFQKDDWQNLKSLTFRVVLQDDQNTLIKEEADLIYKSIIFSLKSIGAQLR